MALMYAVETSEKEICMIGTGLRFVLLRDEATWGMCTLALLVTTYNTDAASLLEQKVVSIDCVTFS